MEYLNTIDTEIPEIIIRIKIISKKIFGGMYKLEQAVNKKQGYISAYLSKGLFMPPDVLYILSNYYDININWLLTGKGSMLINDKENVEVINSESKEVPILTNRVALELIEELRKAREERQLFRVAEEVAEYKG